jgi:hypothetical protein
MAQFYVITRSGSKRSSKRVAIIGGLTSRRSAASEAFGAVRAYQQGQTKGIVTKTKKVSGRPSVQGFVAADAAFSAWVEKGPTKVRHTLRRAVQRGDLSPLNLR